MKKNTTSITITNTNPFNNDLSQNMEFILIPLSKKDIFLIALLIFEIFNLILIKLFKHSF